MDRIRAVISKSIFDTWELDWNELLELKEKSQLGGSYNFKQNGHINLTKV